jgi:2-C-methyl-D-erythritol 2,4-cyclodiphosphate synthase
VFLRAILQKVHDRHYKIGNIDVSIIAQAPKLAPHLLLMREMLAQDLQVSINDINLKATTHEKLDAIGNKLGIAAHAVALVVKNP